MNIIRSLFETKANSVSIILDRTNQTYYPGETISGRLMFSLAAVIDASRIELVFHGSARTLLNQPVSMPQIYNIHDGNTNALLRKKTTNDKIIYENLEIFRIMFQFPRRNESKFETGQHELPFQFIIPPNVPSTFQYRNSAFIEYQIKATVGTKTKETNIDICGFPSVFPSELHAPVFDVKSKKVGIFNAKQLNMRCEIPRTGWTLGSTINIVCTIDNHSDKLMSLSASLKQEIKITALNYQETYQEKILTTFSQQIESQCIGRKFYIPLTLPNKLPVVHNTCRTIQINYFIEVKLDIPLSINHHCKLPIIITNQQLNQSAHYYQQPIQQSHSVGPVLAPVSQSFYPPLNNQDEIGVPSAPPISFEHIQPEAPPAYSEYSSNSLISPYPRIPFKN